mmetsp:Transcript_18374/g.43023  ORF Transcript_18374/g.43023 Transcript_18374/m.43023 type:complete len:201 (+) Transcript_18374:2611-3213(+)
MRVHHVFLPRLALSRHLQRDCSTDACQQLRHAAASATPRSCDVAGYLLVQRIWTAEHELIQKTFVAAGVCRKRAFQILPRRQRDPGIKLRELLQGMFEGHPSCLGADAIQLVLPELLKVVNYLSSKRTLIAQSLGQVAEVNCLLLEELLEVAANDLIDMSAHLVAAHSRGDFEHGDQVCGHLVDVQNISLKVICMHLRRC